MCRVLLRQLSGGMLMSCVRSFRTRVTCATSISRRMRSSTWCPCSTSGSWSRSSSRWQHSQHQVSASVGLQLTCPFCAENLGFFGAKTKSCILPRSTFMKRMGNGDWFACLLVGSAACVLQPQTETLGATGCWRAASVKRAPSTAAQTGRGPQPLVTGAQACGTAQLNARGTGQQSAAGRGRQTGQHPGSGSRLIWIGRGAGMLEGGLIGAGALAAGGAAGTCLSSMLVPKDHGDGPAGWTM